MRTYRIRSFIFMLFTLSLILYQGSSFSQTKTPKRVAILPFTMNADRDLSFLRDGIVDMMGSRLAWKGEVDIIQKGIVKGIDLLSVSISGKMEIGMGDKFKRLVSEIGNIPLLRRVNKVAGLMEDVKEVYRQYPDSPKGLDAWKARLTPIYDAAKAL